jgi:hypothetical protein
MGLAMPAGEHRTQTVTAFVEHCRRFIGEQGLFGLVRSNP